jgi:hypothetical protein
MLANALLLRGDAEGSARAAEDAIRLEPASAFSGIGWAQAYVARAFGGDCDGCRQMLAEARPMLPTPAGHATSGQLVMLYAAVHGSAVVGLESEIADFYEAVAARVSDFPVSFFDLTLAERVAGIAAGASALWDRAEEHFERAARLAEETPILIEQPQVRYWHASTLARRGDPSDRTRAVAMLKTALDDFESIGMPLHWAMTDALLRASPDLWT